MDEKTAEIKGQDDLFNVIMDKDDLSWQEIIRDLVRENQMDPWDINVSVLAKKYMEILKKLKELDFRLTGKVVLAAAVLLKMKSSRLVGADLDRLDSLFAQGEDVEYDEFDSDGVGDGSVVFDKQDFKILPRTPQARKRKVSVYELMEALQKAMEVKKRRVMRDLPGIEFEAPIKSRDITEIIKEVYDRIKGYFFKNKTKLTFSQLIPSGSKEDKVYTFIPLLHLTNARKIDLDQPEHFGEIEIMLLKNRDEINKELGLT